MYITIFQYYNTSINYNNYIYIYKYIIIIFSILLFYNYKKEIIINKMESI